MKKKIKMTKKETAQSLVELSLFLVLLITLIAGIVDLGRAIFTRFVMQDAVEEGIVFGTSYPTDCNQIIDRVRYNLSDLVSADDIVVSVTEEKNDGTFASCYTIPFSQVYAGKRMRVEATLPFEVTMPFLGAITGQTIQLRATANGIILRPQPQE